MLHATPDQSDPYNIFKITLSPQANQSLRFTFLLQWACGVQVGLLFSLSLFFFSSCFAHACCAVVPCQNQSMTTPTLVSTFASNPLASAPIASIIDVTSS